MRRLIASAIVVLAGLVASIGGLPGEAAAAEYLLAGGHPNTLVMIDTAARKVVRSFKIPGRGYPLTITPSPDGKIAYVLTNRWESVSGIDLDTGKEVFRADFSSPGRRVKGMFAMDISPDGKELFVFQSPVKLGLGEYTVEDTRIAVFRTSDGVGAKAVRSFPAPRRTAILAFSKDGSKLYSVSWDISIHDPKTGKVTGVHKVRNWGRKNYSEPDVLDVWAQWEQAGVFSTPYYAVRTDKAPDDPTAYKTGFLTLDLESGKFEMNDFENTENIIFSSVVNPVRRNEVFMVYTTLTKMDRNQNKVVKRINLDHTYYAVNISSDGKEIYVGGTMDDIAVYDTESLEKIGSIKMPNGADQALASLRMIKR